MASILDVGLASIFSSILVFLLTYAIVWGVLSWKKWMDDQPGVYAIIAFTVALLMAAAPPARDFVLFIAPWYAALGIFFFFVLFLISMFGKGSKDFSDILDSPVITNWVSILVILILIMGIAVSFGPALVPGGNAGTVDPGVGTVGGPVAGQPGSTATSDFTTNVVNTVFHPKVMGMVITFAIASVAIYFLGAKPSN
jgi:hypothetical protein